MVAPRLWNDLSSDLRNAATVTVFKFNRIPFIVKLISGAVVEGQDVVLVFYINTVNVCSMIFFRNPFVLFILTSLFYIF